MVTLFVKCLYGLDVMSLLEIIKQSFHTHTFVYILNRVFFIFYINTWKQIRQFNYSIQYNIGNIFIK